MEDAVERRVRTVPMPGDPETPYFGKYLPLGVDLDSLYRHAKGLVDAIDKLKKMKK